MTVRDFSAVRGDITLRADVAVVGSGPGGAAVSRALAAGGARVVVLEEGPAVSRFRPNLAHTNRYHMQEGGAMMARGSHLFPIAAGRGVGGGSLVNSALCFRTPDYVLDSWVEKLGGDRRYGPEAMAPVLDELMARLGVGLTSETIAGENNLIVARGAAALGLPGGLAPRNAPDCQGCGLCNYGCPIGGKASVDRNLVKDAMADGAVVQADVKVDEILVRSGRATGVRGDAMHPDTREVVGRLTVESDAVVVSCGGIGTPRLLSVSGLGSRLGAAVGRGLHVHPGNAVLGECDHEVRMWTGATQGAFFEHPDLPGVLPHTLSAPPGAMLLVLGHVGQEAKRSMKRLPHLCGCVVMISDRGEGRVGARADGRADIQYHFEPSDVDRIKEGMYQTARVLLAGGARRVFAPVHGTGKHETAEGLRDDVAPRRIEDFTLYASHPMSSCRMGLDGRASVIGVDGQAHQLPGLYLADSSIFPTSLGVNPQLTTMALATVIGREMIRTGF